MHAHASSVDVHMKVHVNERMCGTIAVQNKHNQPLTNHFALEMYRLIVRAT